MKNSRENQKMSGSMCSVMLQNCSSSGSEGVEGAIGYSSEMV